MRGEKKLRPLDYDDVLSFEECQGRLSEVEETFDRVRVKYARPAGRDTSLDTRKIEQGDNKLLADCIGVLLPLAIQGVVQNEIEVAGQEGFDDTLFAKIAKIQAEIMWYAADFENSGVEVVGSAPRRERGIAGLLKGLRRKRR